MSLSMIQIWLIAIALLLLVEFATSALTTIWFAGGALIALICAFFGGPLWLQVILFIAGSIVLLFLTRPRHEINRTERYLPISLSLCSASKSCSNSTFPV